MLRNIDIRVCAWEQDNNDVEVILHLIKIKLYPTIYESHNLNKTYFLLSSIISNFKSNTRENIKLIKKLL